MKYLILLWLFTCMAFVLGGLVYKYHKPVTVENLEMRAVRVKVNGLDVTIPARDKWEER